MKSRHDASAIEVLDGVKAVRKRPGMYFGDVRDGSGLHHLIWEVVGNSLDQHLARAATELHVEVANGWVTVRDDGPGIPVDPVGPDGAPALESVFTRLHAGPTWDGHFPHVHVGLFGVGVAAVNAVCAQLEVETTRDGAAWAQAYEQGRPIAPLRRLGACAVEGTRLRFRPDPTIFDPVVFDVAAIGQRLQELAWLNPLLRVFFQEKRLPGRGGLAAWVRSEGAARGGVDPLYATCRPIDEVWVDLAFGWSSDRGTIVRSFVNMTETQLAGTHVQGLWEGLSRWIEHLGAAGAGSTELAKRSLGPGLVAVVHVGLQAPGFDSPTRAHLMTPLAAKAVRGVLDGDVPRLMRNPRLCDYLRRRIRAQGPAVE